MGFMSRKVLPACGSMCVCCPALRSSSRQPVKRYKKLLADIFPKSLDGPPNERKIAKLCEYASRNPFRIPKIAKYLEQRSSKELRSEHIKSITIIMETFNKLLYMCKDQMAYFSGSLLDVITEVMDNTDDKIRMLGCQTLTHFIYNQTDTTYMRNIQSLVVKVCALAREAGEEPEKQCLRASALQCLSAMVWLMDQFSHILDDFDEIVHVSLDNYGVDAEVGDDRGESNHNWVDEVIRCEGRSGAGIASDVHLGLMTVRPRPEKKDPSMLTREEIETPKVWAQICIQKMVELAKESTTMRRVLDPMLVYFDTKRHWDTRHGLALLVLSDMSYFVEDSGMEQLILSTIIRHMDHKNVSHDPQIKSNIVQIATAVARQLRSQGVIAEIGAISDLCRHLRKSLQATAEMVGQQESQWNISLQNSIEDCLLEITKGIGDAGPLFDLMARTLEKLPVAGVVARSIIGSLLILAHIISLASVHSQSQQGFPEMLLLQLLKTMVHADVEARIGAHWIFATILVPTADYPRHEGLYEPRRWQSKTAAAFASASALLEKLRKEKEYVNADKLGNDAHDIREREVVDDERKHGWPRKRSPKFSKISCSIIDRRAGSTSSADEEPNIVKLTEDQITQLLSAFWVQANLPDNLPSNFEAIGRSFSLTLLSSRMKNSNHNIMVRFFQLSLSLRNVSLTLNGRLPPSCQRSLFTLATTMLMFAAKNYQFTELTDLLKPSITYDVDRYFHIGDDLQVYVKPQVDMREYGSIADQEAAVSSLTELRIIVDEFEKALLDIMARSLSSVTEVSMDELAKQLSEMFTPDDAFLFTPQSVLNMDLIQALSLCKGSASFDEDSTPSPSVEDDIISESSVADLPRFLSKVPASSALSQILTVGQLLESALEVAGQVAGSSISTTPLPYSAMAGQCEALGMVTRKKLSTWLGDPKADKLLLTVSADGQSAIKKISYDEPRKDGVFPTESWMALRLPPASPFDNFLKAAGC